MAFEFFRIPVENIHHPTIRHYVGMFNDTHALYENAGDAIRQNEQAGRYRSVGFSWQRLVDDGHVQPLPPGIHASIPMRLTHTKELAWEANGCLAYSGHVSKSQIDYAVRLYGCAARRREGAGEPMVTPGSFWRDREGGEETREFIPTGKPPPQNYLWRDHARLAPIPHFTEIAERLGIPHENWTVPEIRRYISLMSDSEAMIHALAEGERLPSAPGIQPSVPERYQAAAGILQFTLAMLQEGFQGRTVDPDFVQKTLAPLAPFGIEVVTITPGQKLLP